MALFRSLENKINIFGANCAVAPYRIYFVCLIGGISFLLVLQRLYLLPHAHTHTHSYIHQKYCLKYIGIFETMANKKNKLDSDQKIIIIFPCANTHTETWERVRICMLYMCIRSFCIFLDKSWNKMEMHGIGLQRKSVHTYNSHKGQHNKITEIFPCYL